ncbi:MAG: DUF6049 family protein, partial [Actinobacteria bacterium]|nr:DUF6049 family protein [Actinomycetota bacterium]
DPSPSPSPDDEAPAAVLVTKLAPRAPMDQDEFFQVKGTITNRGSRPLADVRVRLRRGEVIRSRPELDLADREPPTTGTRVGVSVRAASDELAPGTSTTFDIRIRVSLLRLSRSPTAIGVYPLRVEVRARVGDEGTSTVGSVATYVPWFPDGPPKGHTRIAWLWPLIDQPRRGPREVVLDRALEQQVSRNGRLDTLLRAAAEGQKGRCDDAAQGPVNAAPRPATVACRGDKVPVTYAVDPDLLFDVRAMAEQPYQLRVREDEARDIDATQVFSSWLGTLREAVATSNVLALPYADPDVVALSQPETGLGDEVARLRVLGESETAAITQRSPLRSVVWPPSGRLTRAALETLSSGGAAAAVLDPVAVAGRDEDSGPTPGAHVGQLGQATGAAVNGLVVDTGLSQLVDRAYDDYPGARLAEQRWLVETAMISAERPSVSRTLVVALPRRGSVVGAVGSNVLYDTGRLPWLCAVPLADVAVGQEACPDEIAVPPREQDPAELERPLTRDLLLSPRFLRSVARARADAAQLTDQVLEPGEEARRTSARLLRARARTESSAWRDDPRAGERLMGLLEDDLEQLRGKVHLQIGSGTVTLTSRTGAISVNVVNELGQQVRVGVRLDTANSARLSLKEVPVELIPPGSSTQISLKVTSATSGKFEVKARLLDRSGNPFGGERTLVVRSTQYGRVALAVTGVAAGVLLLAVGVRITRRALRR